MPVFSTKYQMIRRLTPGYKIFYLSNAMMLAGWQGNVLGRWSSVSGNRSINLLILLGI